MRVLIFFLIVLFANAIGAQIAVNKQIFIQHYEGAIADKYPISMRLVNWGNGSLVGEYSYKKVGKSITLYGDFKENNVFEMSEYAGDQMTGKFSGQFANKSLIKGTWSSPDGKKSLSFEVKATTTTDDASGWAGVWHLNDVWDGGTLIIGDVTKDSLDFAVSVVRTAHIGEIWGTAARSEDKAIFKRVEFTYEGETDSEPCYITFELKGDHIQVEQVSSGMACGFGMRAYAGGRFDNKVIEMKPALSFGSGDGNVFPNQSLHDGFKHLVGGNMYELFAFNMQGYEHLEQAPEDGFEATVVQGGVYGMYMSNEAIIMYTKTGKYWAMTIDFEGKQPVLRYFTNAAEYQLKFPQSISNWADRFPDYPVRYE